jgi:ribonuclease HII
MEEKMNSLREFDETYEGTVLGVDEAGRGPLAGAVVAGAVIIPEYFSELDEINDSKKLTEKKREKLFEIIMEKCIVGIGISDEKEIDEVNILNATFSAMRKAISQVTEKTEFDVVLVDGNHKIKGYMGKQEEVIKGDAKSLSIAAASIVAKVTRDRMMLEVAKEFPEYNFAKHKGYGTKLHREILLEKGPCKYHRKSFLKKILGDKSQDKISEGKNNKGKLEKKVDKNRGLKLF